MLRFQRLAGNQAVTARLAQRQQSSLPRASIIQRYVAVLYPSSDRQLDIFFGDNYFKDLQLPGNEIDTVYRLRELATLFVEAAIAQNITNTSAARTFRYPEDVRHGDYVFKAHWDTREKRLTLFGIEYTGNNPNNIIKPVSALARKLQTQVALSAADNGPMAAIEQVFRTANVAIDAVHVEVSEGSVVTMIPPANFVLQYYRNPVNFNVVLPRLQAMNRNQGNPNAPRPHVLQLDEANRLVMLEKVEAINALLKNLGGNEHERAAMQRRWVAENAEQLFFDIRAAVLDLAVEGISQGDTRLDNVGRRNGRFMLFDYNMSQAASWQTIRRDLAAFILSLEGRGVVLPSELKTNPLDGAAIPEALAKLPN